MRYHKYYADEASNYYWITNAPRWVRWLVAIIVWAIIIQALLIK